MKLAVCIPVYQVDVCALVRQLHHEIEQNKLQVEICVLDDASTQEIRATNEAIRPLCATYVELKTNLGRSAIRNQFLNYTQAENLLFVDCDILPVSESFLRNYLHIADAAIVSCGGHIYPDTPPKQSEQLKWKVGRERESRRLEVRRTCGWKSFMPSNFCIKRAVFERIKFEERLSGYGHEDTLFAFRLYQKGIAITHLDNPVQITDTEQNQIYLQKTEQGIRNLNHVAQLLNQDGEFERGIRLLKFYRQLKTTGLLPLFMGFFTWIESPLRRKLLQAALPLCCFDLYKLGMLAKVRKELIG
ncbi:MAG: glycosyltransferase [Bacteroidetes bacterium]|nr:glycosyltransferase [Bacteroidota bacterium]